jgi:predicted O-methyltransferase YrrM
LNTLFRIQSSIKHWLDKVDEHSIHSPFFYDFYLRIIRGETKSHFTDIEKLRTQLLQNNSIIKLKDLGDTSAYFKSEDRSISKIAHTSLTDAKYCELFYRIAENIEAENIVELGTSMGITSLYLAQLKKSRVTTFEGNPDLINIAKTNFELFGKKNIEIIEGNIDQTLSDYLQNPAKIDFALMDANHRYEPTVRYFNWIAKRMSDTGIIVIDDIYRSPEMAKAWNELRKHDLVYSSVDLFTCGILFFDLSLTKQHFIWSY